MLPVGAMADVESLGEGLRIALPLTALGVTIARDDPSGRREFYRAFAVSAALTLVLKKSIDDQRPNGEPEAFPSGHATNAFASAAFMHRRYGWRYAAPAYAASALVGWSRIEADEHDPADVAAGALVGILAASLFTHPLPGRVAVQPELGPGYAGIRVRGRW